MSTDPARFDKVLAEPPTKGYRGLLPLREPQKQPTPETDQALPLAPSTYRQRIEALLTVRARTSVQSILDACADPHVCVNNEGWFTLVNAAACRLLRCQTEELIGQNAREILNYSHPDGTPYSAAECPITAALHSGRQSQIDRVTFWRTDGYPLSVTCTTRPIVEGGRVVGAVVGFRDISDRLATEASQAKDLTEAQLLAKAHSESLAYVSHEIRTSLNAVLGLASFGAETTAEATTRETFAHIMDAGQVLLDILNNVLDLAKIEVGKLSISRVSFNPAWLVERAAELISAQVSAKGLTLRAEKDQHLPTTYLGDDSRLLQVLSNLLNNAVKFTSNGTITLWAGWENGLVLRVSDTGIGIAETQIARLFLPFEQASDLTQRYFGGSGLGLTITKKLVDMMGGEIRVQSSLGQGSTFEIRLPPTPVLTTR